MVLLFQLHKALGKRANRQADTAFKQRQVKETLESTSALKREREEQQKEEAETRHQQNSLANGGIPSGALARPGARMVNVNLIVSYLMAFKSSFDPENSSGSEIGSRRLFNSGLGEHVRLGIEVACARTERCAHAETEANCKQQSYEGWLVKYVFFLNFKHF